MGSGSTRGVQRNGGGLLGGWASGGLWRLIAGFLHCLAASGALASARLHSQQHAGRHAVLDLRLPSGCGLLRGVLRSDQRAEVDVCPRSMHRRTSTGAGWGAGRRPRPVRARSCLSASPCKLAVPWPLARWAQLEVAQSGPPGEPPAHCTLAPSAGVAVRSLHQQLCALSCLACGAACCPL